MIAKAFALVAGAYLVWVALVFLGQRALLYPGARRPAPAAAPSVAGLERLWVETRGGRVESWFLPPIGATGGDVPAVLHFHGNGELIDDWPYLVDGLRRLGFAVLLVEYPGYGRSAGKPTQASVTEAALAAYDALAARPGVDATRIVAWGRSLGGGAACRLAARRPVAGLALLSTFTDVRSFARGWLVPGFLALDPFDNREVVAAFEGPVLVSHGRADDMIPYRHGEVLAAAARNGRLVTFDCAHNDCPPDFDAHWRDVAGLLPSTPRREP